MIAMNTLLEAVLKRVGVTPAEDARGRPADEIIAEIKEREAEKVERVRRRTEIAIESRKGRRRGRSGE